MAVARNIDVGLLRTLVAVAQHGSMTAAGQALNLTQAAISQQVKRLEQLMNAPLIERDRKRLRLTSAGERLLSRARRMIAMNDEIYGLMTQPEHEGKIRLGVPCDVVHPFLPPILRNFTRTYPLIEVSIRSGNTYSLLSDVEAGNLDLTLTTETAPCPENGPLFIDQLVWVGAHRGQACRLDVVPLAFVGPNCAFRKSSIEALDAIGRDWLVKYELFDEMALNAIVSADLAVKPALLSTLPAELQTVSPTSGLPELPSIFINLKGLHADQGPMLDSFAEHIRNHFAKLPAKPAPSARSRFQYRPGASRLPAHIDAP